MNGFPATYGYADRFGSPNCRPQSRPARSIMLEVRRCEREAAPLLWRVADGDAISRGIAGRQRVTAPDWALVLSALKTLLETGKPLSVASRGGA
jgi:hypothetical protein